MNVVSRRTMMQSVLVGAARTQYSDLLARLAARLRPVGKLLTVDVVLSGLVRRVHGRRS
jgi:hypothetical protein